MKLRLILLLMIFTAACIVTAVAQEGDNFNYVDINKANSRIAFLETENVNHTDTIASNDERKAFLENRISKSETRQEKIKENIEYTTKTNLELNDLYRESKDRKTKDRLDEYREELVSVVYLLSEERKALEKQTKEDKKEVEFLTKDSARRERLIEKNKGEIEQLKNDISRTEAKNSEISTKLDSIMNQIEGFRGEFTTEPGN